MTIRTQRRFYWITAATLTVATVAWWLNFTTPLAGSSPGSSPRNSSESSVTEADVDKIGTANGVNASTNNQPSLSSFRPYWDRPLRYPLYDPPPPPPPAVTPPPPLRLRLLGTIVEEDRSEAILITASGNVEMHRVGATVDKAVIQSIGDGSIEVLYHDEILTLIPYPGS